MTEVEKIKLGDLSKPFAEADVEWRLQQSGEKNGKIWAKCLVYVTNRAIMERLDEVCGAENWKNDYRPAPDGGVLCGISIRIGDEWVTKWDGSDNTAVEAIKGGLSGAMKRAGVQWGIGRYLYKLEEGFATISDKGRFRGKTKENKHFKWNPPSLPKWALPKGAKPETRGDNKPIEPKGESKEKPKDDKNFKFLQAMDAQQERVGDDAFYKVLGGAGYEKAKDIEKRAEQETVFKALCDLPNKGGK
jgi:hypothetical protein